MRILIYLITLMGFGITATPSITAYPELSNEPIPVDSITILNYSGQLPRSSYYPLAPPPRRRRSGETQEEYEQIYQEVSEKAEQEYQKRLKEEFPNHDPDRDMPIPPKSGLILSSEYKYHPSIDWDTKITLNERKSKKLRAILECRTKENLDGYAPADCWNPRDGVIYWKDGKIVHFYSICFECSQVYQNWDWDLGFNQQLKCIDLIELKKELKRIRKEKL